MLAAMAALNNRSARPNPTTIGTCLMDPASSLLSRAARAPTVSYLRLVEYARSVTVPKSAAQMISKSVCISGLWFELQAAMHKLGQEKPASGTTIGTGLLFCRCVHGCSVLSRRMGASSALSPLGPFGSYRRPRDPIALPPPLLRKRSAPFQSDGVSNGQRHIEFGRHRWQRVLAIARGLKPLLDRALICVPSSSN
jgi:hypothetical protein